MRFVKTCGFQQTRAINRASEMYAQESLIAKFGIGFCSHVHATKVRRPSGTVQTMHDISANQLLTIREHFDSVSTDLTSGKL
ncbi:ASPIC/UnbV domain-containing protein [Candidatus Poribacteria bacterium]